MPLMFEKPKTKFSFKALINLFKPLQELLNRIQTLEPRGNRPFQMTFEDQLKALIYYHLEEHV